MKKLKEYEVGSYFNDSLILSNITQGKTKKNSPYLKVEFTDGDSYIKANIWEATIVSAKKLFNTEPSSIIDITGIVSEYEGTKQLEITNIQDSSNTLDYFESNQLAIDDLWLDLNRNLEILKYSSSLFDITNEIIQQNKKLFCSCPAAIAVHHNYKGGLLEHTLETVIFSEAITPVHCDRYLVIAGAILHDIGKIRSYQMNGLVAEMTISGKMHDHIIDGCCILETYRTADNTNIIDLLQHIIASHHGSMDKGSPVYPICREALVVHYADELSAKMNMIKKAEDGKDILTDKIWALNNREFITHKEILNILANSKIDPSAEVVKDDTL